MGPVLCPASRVATAGPAHGGFKPQTLVVSQVRSPDSDPEVSAGTLSLKAHGRVLPGRALGVWWLLAIPVSWLVMAHLPVVSLSLWACVWVTVTGLGPPSSKMTSS